MRPRAARAVRRGFASARKGCFSCCPPPVFRGGYRVFLAPNRNNVAIEHVLDVTWVKHVKSYLTRTPTKCHRTGPDASQATIFEPTMPLGRGDRQYVLNLTGDNGQAFDVFQRMDTIADAVPKS